MACALPLPGFQLPAIARGWGSPAHQLLEARGVLGPALLEVLQGAAESRANKLTHGEFEMEATWSTRKYMPFVMQRISVAVQIAAATEIRQAMGVGLGPSAA